jgi:hypothetical protein
MTWTSEQVLALAPDATSAKRGQGLATLRKWQNLSRLDQVVWGECQGSGSKPYRSQIDLSEPAFRCSCPSRKFPCKHGLGLFLLLAQSEHEFAPADPPDWVSEWLATRQKRQAKQQTKQAETLKAAIADPEAQAKRIAKRTKKVDGGVAELRQWMADLMRRGLATAPTMTYRDWEQVAARMVDAQAAGLARRVQAMAGIPNTGTSWPEQLLEQLGELHLLLESYSRIPDLPANLQADVRSQIGWTLTQDEVLAAPAKVVHDRWSVLGLRDELTDNLRMRRIWLRGESSQQVALILLFAHGQQPFDQMFLPGMVVSAELAFFPSAYLQRAIVKSRSHETGEVMSAPPAYDLIAPALAEYSAALTKQPWLERMTVSLAPVTVVQYKAHWYVCDHQRSGLPIAPNYDGIWSLVAMSGGHPIGLTGEWDGTTFYPLSAWVDGQFVGV